MSYGPPQDLPGLHAQLEQRVRALERRADLTAGIPAETLTVTGSRGGNAALASLLSVLAELGLIVDHSTA